MIPTATTVNGNPKRNIMNPSIANSIILIQKIPSVRILRNSVCNFLNAPLPTRIKKSP